MSVLWGASVAPKFFLPTVFPRRGFPPGAPAGTSSITSPEGTDSVTGDLPHVRSPPPPSGVLIIFRRRPSPTFLVVVHHPLGSETFLPSARSSDREAGCISPGTNLPPFVYRFFQRVCPRLTSLRLHSTTGRNDRRETRAPFPGIVGLSASSISPQQSRRQVCPATLASHPLKFSSFPLPRDYYADGSYVNSLWSPTTERSGRVRRRYGYFGTYR